MYTQQTLDKKDKRRSWFYFNRQHFFKTKLLLISYNLIKN